MVGPDFLLFFGTEFSNLVRSKVVFPDQMVGPDLHLGDKTFVPAQLLGSEQNVWFGARTPH